MSDAIRSTSIDLEEDTRSHSIKLLNECLANTLYAVLASKFAHWNVKGAGFYPAHKLFDEVYEFYSESADIIAERITALGGTAEGRLADIAGSSNIIYDAEDTALVEEHMKAMASMLCQVANQYRLAIVDNLLDDMATQDLFITLTRDADKFIYFLEADLRRS